MSATITKWAGPPCAGFRFGARAETMRLGRFAGGLMVLAASAAARLGDGWNSGGKHGIFAGGMELFFAGARDQGMIRQPVFGMEGLHLLERCRGHKRGHRR